MQQHRYILEPYNGLKTRYTCPSCKASKKFSLYIDTETGEHVAQHVGRCNRETNCSYHYTPKQYFQDNNISFDTTERLLKNVETQKPFVAPQPKPVSYIPLEAFQQTLQGYENNNFIDFLLKLFGLETTELLIKKYYIGSSKHWPGAVIHWQLDIDWNIRTGKIMLYSATTGKRIKEPFNHIHWVHKALQQPEFELKQCLFGEHLLHDSNKKVMLFESEKSAIIASARFPDYVCLATGGADGLNIDKCDVLNRYGQPVILFPDLSKPKEGNPTTFEKWAKLADLHLKNYTLSDILERTATDGQRQAGYDMGDYYIKIIELEKAQAQQKQPGATVQHKVEAAQHLPASASVQNNNAATSAKPKPETWENEIAELETYFQSIVLPAEPVPVNNYNTIINAASFVDTGLSYIKHNNGKPTYLPYLHRLQELKNYLTLNL